MNCRSLFISQKIVFTIYNTQCKNEIKKMRLEKTYLYKMYIRQGIPQQTGRGQIAHLIAIPQATLFSKMKMSK